MPIRWTFFWYSDNVRRQSMTSNQRFHSLLNDWATPLNSNYTSYAKTQHFYSKVLITICTHLLAYIETGRERTCKNSTMVSYNGHSRPGQKSLLFFRSFEGHFVGWMCKHNKVIQSEMISMKRSLKKDPGQRKTKGQKEGGCKAGGGSEIDMF